MHFYLPGFGRAQNNLKVASKGRVCVFGTAELLRASETSKHWRTVLSQPERRDLVYNMGFETSSGKLKSGKDSWTPGVRTRFHLHSSLVSCCLWIYAENISMLVGRLK